MAIHFRVFVDTLTKTKDGHPPDGTLASIFTVVKLYERYASGSVSAVHILYWLSDKDQEAKRCAPVSILHMRKP